MLKKHDAISKEYRLYIEGFLKDWYKSYHDEPQAELFDAIYYSLTAGGKRLRPIFTFAFCKMCCGDWKIAAPFAAAVEMIHTYSLIHDDLPCMDNDDYRRGRLTNHKVFGEAMAILAGDGLLTDAFTMASTAQLQANAVVEGVRILSQCAGSLGMVGGQVLDMKSEDRALTEQEVLEIQSRKTGALIRAACCTGVLAGGGSIQQLKSAASFAENLGLAFQIRDDMLDIIGNAEELGKAVGVDDNKNTFVKLYGIEKCEQLVAFYTENAISTLDCFENTEYIIALARSLTARTV